LKEELSPDVVATSIKYFPVPEPKEIKGIEFLIGHQLDRLERKETTTKEWNFHGKERDKRLLINQEHMFVEFTVYKSFDDLTTHFIAVVDSLFDTFSELQVRRLGLRYINTLDIPGSNIFRWNAYLNRDLLSIFNVPSDKTKIIRAFHNLELNFGDFTLRFQYGMQNPDYPAPIKRKLFILDYDAYTTGLLTKEDIHQSLPIFHEGIEHLFENSITDKLRAKMNVER